MSRLVLDALIVLTWCFPDEESQKALEISERIAAGDRVVVPAFLAARNAQCASGGGTAEAAHI